MLKENGEWIEFLEIADGLRKRMMQKTMEQVFKLLESAEILLDKGGEIIGAGLYTYAIEEFGKFLVLKKGRSLNGKVKIKYKNEFRKHPVKFRLAIDYLPRECTEIGVVGF